MNSPHNDCSCVSLGGSWRQNPRHTEQSDIDSPSMTLCVVELGEPGQLGQQGGTFELEGARQLGEQGRAEELHAGWSGSDFN